jgi:[ribosomal protein S18]-alanine N-acetyltransferase
VTATGSTASQVSPGQVGPGQVGPDQVRPVQVAIVAMRRRHLRRVVRIDAQERGDRWSPALFLAELRRGDVDRRYLVALDGGTVVGFAGMVFVGGDGHVTTIAVDDTHRRRGIGGALLAALAHDARRRGVDALTLEVRAGNAPAMALYRQFGFAPAGVRKGYYADDGEDALVLWAEGVTGDDYAARLARLGHGDPPAGTTGTHGDPHQETTT